MDVNVRAKLGESPGRPGVVEMDVAEKHMADMARRKTDGAQFGGDIGKCRFGTAIEKCQPFAGFDSGRRGDAGAT